MSRGITLRLTGGRPGGPLVRFFVVLLLRLNSQTTENPCRKEHITSMIKKRTRGGGGGGGASGESDGIPSVCRIGDRCPD